MSTLVGRACQRLHFMETRSGADHAGSRKHRHLQQDAAQLSQMVQNVRRSHLHRASRHGTHGRVCSSHSGLSVPRRRSCALSETVLRIKDGLPKMKDVPKEMGGSGISMPEKALQASSLNKALQPTAPHQRLSFGVERLL